MFLFLVSWLVLSVLGGIVIGKAIHRADAVELGRTPDGRSVHELGQPDGPRLTTPAPASPSGPTPQLHAWAA
jgi:hypothetical protein